MMVRRAVLLPALFLGLAAACSFGASIEQHPCPPGGTNLTYVNFGQGFFTAYCVRCHGGPGGYSSRAFTTLDAIRAEKDRIFINAAADNTSMPPGPDGPPDSARQELADWLACGAP
jgi:hypothetical protein